jgi:hypothetical protein
MQIQIEPKAAYLYVHVEGPFELFQAKEFHQRILDMSSAHGLSRILIDSRQLKGNISTMDRFEAGSFSEIKPSKLQTAIVASEEHILPDKFYENVTNNRGINTKVTSNINEALDWLKVKSANQEAANKSKQNKL